MMYICVKIMIIAYLLELCCEYLVWVNQPQLESHWLILTLVTPLQMAPRKRPRERWFMFALDVIWKEHEIPKDDLHVPKNGLLMNWYVQVVKAT